MARKKQTVSKKQTASRLPQGKDMTQKPTSFKEMAAQIRLSESYISLLLGVTVVVVVFFMAVVLLKQFMPPLESKQDVSSTNTQESSKENSFPTTYVVVEGDDLMKISQRFYSTSDHYIDIAKANNLVDSNNLNIGVKLIIPRIDPGKLTGDRVMGQENLAPIAGDSYVVSEGDLLWDIAVRAYGDGFKWTDIAKANNLESPDAISAGMTIIIPR